MTALDNFQDALTAAGSHGKGSAWTCPNHEDRTASLSVNQGSKGVVFTCHAGCDHGAIMNSLSLTESDLFDDELPPQSREPEKIYNYVDQDGVLLFQKLRYPNKKFSQRAPSPVGGWFWKLDGVERVLYNLPEVANAKTNGETVYVVEGERDADTLISTGLVATTNFDGAGKWKPKYNHWFDGLDVIIIADNDEPGLAHAEIVRQNLVPVAKSVVVLKSMYGNDITDHVALGHKLEDLVPHLIPVVQPDSETHPGRRLVLTAAADIEPEPVVWAWEDEGCGRIPAGSLGLAAGREGTGKSCFGIYLTAKLTKGLLPGKFYGQTKNVIIVAVEDSWKHTIVPRLMAAGADRSRVFRAEVQTEDYSDITLSLPTDNMLLEEAIVENNIGMVLIDPLMSAISGNLDTHKEREVRKALDPLAQMAARTDAIILGIAHFSKSSTTDAASLITGSGGFKNVARFIFGFAADEEEQKLVLTQVKNSLGRSDLPSLEYRIISATVPTTKGDADVGRFIVDGESDKTVGEILASNGRVSSDPRPGEEAEEFLRRVLKDGPAKSATVEDEARMLGIAVRTLKRIKKKMGIASKKRGTEWFMALPEHAGDM